MKWKPCFQSSLKAITSVPFIVTKSGKTKLSNYTSLPCNSFLQKRAEVQIKFLNLSFS